MTIPKTNWKWNKHGMKEWSCTRDVQLNRGRLSDVFNVAGPCRILCMFMEITEAVPAGTLNMRWVLDSDAGGTRVIGDTIDIAASALGDFYVAELDGTAIIQVTTATGLIHGYWYEHQDDAGTIVTDGGIDITLSDMTLSAGAGTMWIYYKPLVDDACIFPGDIATSTTSSTTSTTSTTTSTTSTTSTTTSTTSTSSTTTSTTSTTTTSTTSTTSSTTSTTSTTSSTSSTSSTTSTTSSTTSTASSTSTTTSTTSTGP